LGSPKLVNKQLSSLDQYGDGGLIVPNVLSVIESAVGKQSDLSSAYKLRRKGDQGKSHCDVRPWQKREKGEGG